MSVRRCALSAFTLIELLVVIAILALLSAILFPVFAKAKAAAKGAQSLSNLRQIGLAWNLYAADYDGVLMRVRTSEPGKELYWWGSWDGSTLRPEEGLLHPFLGSEAVRSDPVFPRGLRTALGLTGYGYNYAYLSPSQYEPPTWEETPIAVQEGEIQSPSETVAFATSARINNWAFAQPTLEGNAYLDPPSYEFPGFHGRHGNMGQVVWTDTHATAKKPALRRTDFGFGFDDADFRRENLGELDQDGDFATDELFDLK